MPGIALVQSGDEAARHTDADTASFVNSCCTDTADRPALRLDLQPLRLEVFTETRISELLGSLDPAVWACLIFSSNSVHHASIRAAIDQQAEAFVTYLHAGGGAVLLHGGGDAPSFLKAELGFEILVRSDEDRRRFAEAADSDDVLLNHPDKVSLHDLAEDRKGLLPSQSGPPVGRLYWEHINLARHSSLVPVLIASGTGDTLLARSRRDATMRVVVCRIPIDWRQNVSLMRNVILYAASGSPTVLAWTSHPVPNEMFVRTLAGGRHVVQRALPSDEVPAAPSWILRHVDLCVAPKRADLDDLAQMPSIIEFLKRGGCLLALGHHGDVDGVSHLEAIAGSSMSRILAEDLANTLGVMPEWGEQRAEDKSIFHLRSVLTALAYLRSIYGAEMFPELPAGKRAALTQRVHNWLKKPGEPVTTSLACLETLALLQGPKRVLRRQATAILRRSGASDADVRLAAQAVTDFATGVQTWDIIEESLAWLEGPGHEAAPGAVIRVCDAIATSARWLEPKRTPACQRLAKRIVGRLGEPTEGVGWLSAEATATALRGLIALHHWSPEEDPDVVRAIAAASSCVRSAYEKRVEPPTAVGWLARIAEAMIMVDQAFPTGADRLRLPTAPQAADLEVARALRDENRELDENLRQLKYASIIGRVACTAVALLIYVSAILSFFILGSLDIGFRWTLALALISLGLAYSLLALRYNLILGLLQQPLQWILRLAGRDLPARGKG